MTYGPQSFHAPDGTEMVVLTRADYERISSEDGRDLAAARAALADPTRYPSAVVKAIIAGDTPLAAWRKHRGMSQQGLADKAGTSQAAVARLERNPDAVGRKGTRMALAAALGIPVSALDDMEA